MIVELLAQGIDVLDPNSAIREASKYGEAVFLVISCAFIFAGVHLVRLRFIEKPRLDADIVKQAAEIANQTKVAEVVGTLSDTTKGLKDVMQVLASCVENIQDTLVIHEHHHVKTHNSFDKLFISMQCVIDAFKHRASSDDEKKAVIRIEEAIRSAQRALESHD